MRERAAVEGIKPTTEKTHRGNPIKRAKWHLGIRSQSKPQDIMNEVYRAMKTLNFVSRCLFFLDKKGLLSVREIKSDNDDLMQTCTLYVKHY